MTVSRHDYLWVTSPNSIYYLHLPSITPFSFFGLTLTIFHLPLFSPCQVLEMTGIWPTHTNVEKYIMGLRDKFPVEVRTCVLL